MELIRAQLGGGPGRSMVAPGSAGARDGILGVDVAATSVDGQPQVAVQVLFDDDVPGFDRTLLDSPMVAELLDHDGAVMLREPFDHDRFRQQLHRERAAGESTTRGVLLLTNGELPPPWVRLAFLPVAIETTDGASLVVRRTTVAELNEGVEVAYGKGALTDDQRAAVLTSIAQRHPDAP